MQREHTPSDLSSAASFIDTASQRHLLRRAALIGLLMRHSVNAGVAAIALGERPTEMHSSARWLLFALLGWSAFRLSTRSQQAWAIAVDYLFTILICLSIPLVTTDVDFFLTNSAPQAIAGTAVVSFAVSLPVLVSLAMTVGVGLAYAAGTSVLTGWDNLAEVLAIYYFAIQWTTASLIRHMLLRVAATADRARRDREAAQAAREVDEAAREYEKEQLALLHDTAASTLLMVGQGVPVSPRRLAVQARRDLDLLRRGPWRPIPPSIELVAALRETVTHVRTDVQWAGLANLWVAGHVADAVVAAAREALNNVDRHAQARTVLIEITRQCVAITDNGIGFNITQTAGGRGITDSIGARMHRVSGSVIIASKPSGGTRVELRWPAFEAAPLPATVPVDPDNLIKRVRSLYAMAIATYALVNLLISVPFSANYTSAVGQLILASLAGAGPLAAIAALRGHRIPSVRLFVIAAIVVVVVQPFLLPPNTIGSQADWVQGSIGWCLLPLLLRIPTRLAAAALIGVWLLGASVELVLNPTGEAWTNIGLGTGSILGVQLFALAFDGLVRDAAAYVHSDVETHRALLISGEVARAVTEDYRRRFASVVGTVIPLLEQLAAEQPVDAALRRGARAQSRRLRALFNQNKSFEKPLMQRIRRAIDAAEAHQIEVVVDVSGELPDLDDDEIAGVVSPLQRLFDTDMASAHLVVTGTADTLSLSVVCRDVSVPATAAAALRHYGVKIVTADHAIWLLIEYPSAAWNSE